MSHCSLQVSEAGLLHRFMSYHRTSNGNKPRGLLLAFSAVAYTSLQYIMMQLFFFLSFLVLSWLSLQQYPKRVSSASNAWGDPGVVFNCGS